MIRSVHTRRCDTTVASTGAATGVTRILRRRARRTGRQQRQWRRSLGRIIAILSKRAAAAIWSRRVFNIGGTTTDVVTAACLL